MNLAYQNKQRGFTLLEVMISMAILVFISYAIFQATTQTYRLRDTLSNEGNFYNSIRLATTIVQRDVSMIYSPTIFLPKQFINPMLSGDPQRIQALQMDNLSRSYDFWSPALDPNGLRPSHFRGSENKMSFISLSYLRLYKETPGSEFAKITYELQEGKDSNSGKSTKTLVKKESPNAFQNEDYQDTFVRTYELLPNIKTFKIAYYQKDGNTLKKSSSWDNDKEETFNQYPDMIEITLEVFGQKNEIFDGIYKMRPEIPLNGLLGSI